MTGHRTILYSHYAHLMIENKNQTLNNNLYLTNNVVNGGIGKKLNKRDMNTIIKVGLLKEALEILHFTKQPGRWADTIVYVSLLHTCIDVKAWPKG